MKQKQKKKKPLGHTLLAGGVAGFVESSICHPLDTVKTRMQLRENHVESLGTRIKHSLVEPDALLRRARHSLVDPVALRLRHSFSEPVSVSSSSFSSPSKSTTAVKHSLVEPENIVRLQMHNYAEPPLVPLRGAGDGGGGAVVPNNNNAARPNVLPSIANTKIKNTTNNIGAVNFGKSSSKTTTTIATKKKNASNFWWNQPRPNATANIDGNNIKRTARSFRTRAGGGADDARASTKNTAVRKQHCRRPVNAGGRYINTATTTTNNNNNNKAWWNLRRNYYSFTNLTAGRGGGGVGRRRQQQLSPSSSKIPVSTYRRTHATETTICIDRSNKPLGPIKTARKIIRKEGFRSLYKGLSAVYVGECFVVVSYRDLARFLFCCFCRPGYGHCTARQVQRLV